MLLSTVPPTTPCPALQCLFSCVCVPKAQRNTVIVPKSSYHIYEEYICARMRHGITVKALAMRNREEDVVREQVKRSYS